MAVVERISHRVAVMYLGQIVEIGPRQSVFGQPHHPYTQKLMAAVPVADPTRRQRERSLLVDEIPSPIRALGDEPERVSLMEVAPVILWLALPPARSEIIRYRHGDKSDRDYRRKQCR